MFRVCVGGQGCIPPFRSRQKHPAFDFLPAGNFLARHLVTSPQGMHGVGVAAGPMLC